MSQQISDPKRLRLHSDMVTATRSRRYGHGNTVTATWSRQHGHGDMVTATLRLHRVKPVAGPSSSWLPLCRDTIKRMIMIMIITTRIVCHLVAGSLSPAAARSRAAGGCAGYNFRRFLARRLASRGFQTFCGTKMGDRRFTGPDFGSLWQGVSDVLCGERRSPPPPLPLSPPLSSQGITVALPAPARSRSLPLPLARYLPSVLIRTGPLPRPRPGPSAGPRAGPRAGLRSGPRAGPRSGPRAGA